MITTKILHFINNGKKDNFFKKTIIKRQLLHYIRKKHQIFFKIKSFIELFKNA